MSVDRTVFVAMLREEWRLHARLFGGRRFAAFPAFVAVLGAGAVAGLVETGTDAGSVVAGLHVLVLGFGLYTGSIGLVGRDAMRTVLGDVTLLLFSGRTLPVAPKRLLGVFLVKDVVYYAALFLLPLTLAFAPVAALGAPVSLGLLFPALVATFVLGIAVTFVAIAAASRGRSGRVVLLAGAAAVGLAWVAGYDPLAVTPYALYRAPLSAGALGSLALTGALCLVGVAGYDPTATRAARTAPDRFGPWRERLGDGDGLLTKSLLDVARSSGGLWKVPFSAGVLFAVSAFLITTVQTVTGVRPSTGLAFGAVVSLTAFTTYNWLTQFDSVDAYRALPVGVSQLFGAKFRAFLVLGVPTAAGFVLLAGALYGGRAVEVGAGVALAVGLSLYLFGLTVYLTGFSPNEFLFDTVLFAGFTAAVSVALVPVLVVALVATPPSPPLLAGVVAVAGFGALVGVGLYRRAVPRWERRYRE
ncbi:MAG: hypothetical protein ABEJ04_01130 [Halobacteriaceae archaeon]